MLEIEALLGLVGSTSLILCALTLESRNLSGFMASAETYLSAKGASTPVMPIIPLPHLTLNRRLCVNHHASALITESPTRWTSTMNSMMRL